VTRRVCYFGDSASIHMVRWANFSVENGWELHFVSDRQHCEGYNEGVIHHRIRSSVPEGLRIPWIRRLSTLAHLFRVIKTINPIIIHAHSIPGYGDYMGPISKLLPDIPIMITAWGFSHIEMEKGRPLRYRLSKMAVNSADVVTTSVPEMRELLVKEYGLNRGKLVTFTWGVDLETFRPMSQEERGILRAREGIPSDSEVVLSPRTMHSHYRIDTIVRSASQVVREHPNTVFILLVGYGTGSYAEKIKSLVHSLGIEDHIRMVSRLLTAQEMAEFYNIADFIVQIPLKDQLSATLLEAMACGAIPVLSGIDVYRERFTESTNVLYTETENPNGLAKTVLKAVDLSRSERNEIMERNREMIGREEDFQVNAQNMIRIYNRLIRDD